MEMIVKQVGTNKALEIYGTESTCSSYPNSGFAYFPGSQGFFFYRFVQEGGDRPHVRATDTSVNLSDGNWHHFVGTYDEMTGYARLYRNGNLVSENNSSTQSSSFQGNFGGNVVGDIVIIASTPSFIYSIYFTQSSAGFSFLTSRVFLL